MANKFIETDSTDIGIKLCSDPQISEHAPKNNPGLLVVNEVWFSLPGSESTLTPRDGTAQQ